MLTKIPVVLMKKVLIQPAHLCWVQVLNQNQYTRYFKLQLLLTTIFQWPTAFQIHVFFTIHCKSTQTLKDAIFHSQRSVLPIYFDGQISFRNAKTLGSPYDVFRRSVLTGT